MVLTLIQSQSDPTAGVAGLVVFISLLIVGFIIYFMPTGIALLRSHPNAAAIMVVNLLLGWLCIGWIVALVWSLTAIDESKRYR
jgi:Superinfection immunity protein